jgi:hypothetical protein
MQMKMYPVIPLAVSVALMAASAQAALVGSLQAPTNVDPPLSQSITTITRTSDGNLDTRGAVEGTLNIMAGHEVGLDTYNGIDLNTFSFVTQYNELNRFGSDVRGGLLTWDFDRGSYLSGKTVGNGVGESQFSLNIDYTFRRTADGKDGLFYISYNGGGLSLDTSDITTHTVSGNQSGVENFNLVSNTSLYQQVLSLPADAGSGVLSVDLTSDLATIAAADGLIRIAYLEREFRGDIRLQNESGLVETVVVPEPSTLSLLGLLGIAGVVLRNRSRK